MNWVLCNQRQGFKEKFLEVSRKGVEGKMMDIFIESNQILRSTVIFNQKNNKATYLRRHKWCFLRLVTCVDWQFYGEPINNIVEEKWEDWWSVIAWRVIKKISEGDDNEF